MKNASWKKLSLFLLGSNSLFLLLRNMLDFENYWKLDIQFSRSVLFNMNSKVFTIYFFIGNQNPTRLDPGPMESITGNSAIMQKMKL